MFQTCGEEHQKVPDGCCYEAVGKSEAFSTLFYYSGSLLVDYAIYVLGFFLQSCSSLNS